MSTYLVALVVSDFECRRRIVDGRTFGVCASPPMAQYLPYSLEIGYPIVNFLERRLRIPYELPKLDMVALPDFVSGAMENWGLVTYRETNMLHDAGKTSSITSKQAIRNVVAHEIAHQWFGNLVSPLRWDYLWLNEGFARYFQYAVYSEVRRDRSLFFLSGFLRCA
jgi:aminopeptidase N